jgi:tetratricopeptide (TPR) repeat protein
MGLNMAIAARFWPPVFVLCADLLTIGSAPAAQYSVDGFVLGERVSPTNPNYQSYTCKQSGDFDEAVRCERTQVKSGKAGNITVFSTLIHAQDGTAIYIMTNAFPVSLSKAVVQNEITTLSTEINEKPAKVEWLPKDAAAPTAVVVTWGQVQLDEIDYDATSDGSQDKSPHLGELIDCLGNLKRSAQDGLPIYRIHGGPGYVYSASFGTAARGNRHYVVVDGSQLAVRLFALSLTDVLKKDQALAPNDYHLWPEVAVLTRRLSLDTSPDVANASLDKVFAKFQRKKLQSHVWSVLPGGPILHLADTEFWPVDIYGPNTEHPKIRSDLQSMLAARSNDPFREFAYYASGDFEGALKSNPNSIISDAIHYAAGHTIVEAVLNDAFGVVKQREKAQAKPAAKATADNPNTDDAMEISGIVSYLMANADLYDAKPLGSFVPQFAERAALAKPHFDAVLQHPATHHADDAAYFMGWLAFHQNKPVEALSYLSQALVIGNRDFEYGALRLTLRIIEKRPPSEQFAIVDADPHFSQQSMLWYAVARAAYRAFDFPLTIKIAERALAALKVPIDRLPLTTDPKRIEEALKKIDPDLGDLNLDELPYLLQAATEFQQYQTFLRSVAGVAPEKAYDTARAIIMKYSLLVDPPDKPGHPPPLAHHDLRQALHLIDITLAAVPSDSQHALLRQWLLYRKVRIMAVYKPEAVHEPIAEMEKEFPDSKLLDDVYAEQVFAQGVMLQDVKGAEATFKFLIRKYPNGNAIDNAYSWMGILYRCAGRKDDAQSINREILRRFSLTRHAKYARERMANPDDCRLDGFSKGS